MPTTITEVRCVVLRKKMDGSHRNPRFVWTEKQTLLVFVRTDDGLVGVGETWSDGGSAEPFVAFIDRDIAPFLVGQDADLIERFWRTLLDRAIVSTRRDISYNALSAVDIALWDLKGKRAGLPLWRMLGGHDRAVLPYASAGLYKDGQSPQAFGAEYAAYVKQGFRGVKIKVGGAPLAVDVDRVAALRSAMGPEPRLMVDAVSNLDVPRAIALARALAPYDITWFEQPVDTADVAGTVRVHREGGLPVAGMENERGLSTFARLIESGAVHYVQFDPVVSGGLSHGRKIAALAEAHFLPVTLHHSNSIVSMLANIHLAAALPNCDSVEFHVLHQPLFERAAPGMLDLHDGRLLAPEAPGLGVDLSDLLAPA